MPESLMDAVGAVSGSSPAYVFMFIEAMADAAGAAGMPNITKLLTLKVWIILAKHLVFVKFMRLVLFLYHIGCLRFGEARA